VTFVPSRKKVDLQKVLASLNTTCTKCGKVVEPQEIKAGEFRGNDPPGMWSDI